MNHTQPENTALALTGASSAALLMNSASMDQLERIADLMCAGKVTVPMHLRGSKGDCFAVVLQSMQWGMNPFAVAQKTHLSQSGALGYEAQLISAALSESGALQGDPDYEFIGDWSKVLGKVEERKSDKGGKYYAATYTKADEAGLGVICRATLKGESKPREVTIMMSQCYPRFSTQWATDPQQQIIYASVRKWGRRHKPGVLLGVYTPDEMNEPGEVHMGMAELVPDEPTAYPDDQFKVNLPKWQEVIESGRKSPEDLIIYAQARNPKTPFTEPQLATLRAFTVKKKNTDATDVLPKSETAVASAAHAQAVLDVTYAEVADKLNAATSEDQLNEAADLIGAVAVPDQRTELTAIYDTRLAQLTH